MESSKRASGRGAHACSDWLRPEIPCHDTCCLCLHCPAPLKIMQVSRTLLIHLMDAVKGHWPRGVAIGHWKMVIDQLWGYRLSMNGRPALNVVGRPCLPAKSCLTTADDRQSMANTFTSIMFDAVENIAKSKLGLTLKDLGFTRYIG